MPKPKYQQIIWDWNGTLLNDAWLCYEITSEQLKALDHPGLTFDEYRDTFGHTVYDFYRRIGVNISRSKFSELAERFHSRYLERLSECSLHEGILDILSEFQKLGISQYILSAHPEDLLLKTIEKHGISHFFSGISGQK
ncbi:MAG: HAD family hydrolase, partial [Candidatus Dadabacteria bacterium]